MLLECRAPLPSTPDAFDIYSPTIAPTTTTAPSQYMKLTGSITTVYSFSIDLIDPESDLFKGYASTLQSEISSIIMRSSMMESVYLQVTGFSAVSAARKRRQATTITTTTKAMAVFEAFAEVAADAVLGDVEGAVENEMKSATDEELESLDADSFNIIGAVVGTIATVPPTCPTTVPTRVEPCIGGKCPTWSSWEDVNACQPDGTRIRTRDCGKDGADSNECLGESSEIIDCTPKECINIACDCDFESDTFGKKNGVCSGKNYFISNSALRWSLNYNDFNF